MLLRDPPRCSSSPGACKPLRSSSRFDFVCLLDPNTFILFFNKATFCQEAQKCQCWFKREKKKEQVPMSSMLNPRELQLASEPAGLKD